MNNTPANIFWAVVALALALALSSLPRWVDGAELSPEWVQLSKVIDGDTIEVKRKLKYRTTQGWAEQITTERVRILGIDTPEARRKNKAGEWDERLADCWGKEATQALTVFVFMGQKSPGSKLVLVPPGGKVPNRDKYGRLLRYVDIHFGPVEIVDTGLLLLKQGHAKEMSFESHPRKQAYKAAEAEARESRLGLWGACKR